MIFGRGDGISGGAVRGRGVYICGRSTLRNL